LASGRPIPDAIARSPELEPGLEFFLEAYLAIARYRQTPDGPRYLPYETILRYADEHNLEGDLREDFVYFMQELDSAQMRYERDLYEQEAKAAERKAKARKGSR
jgi:hypothetical protein